MIRSRLLLIAALALTAASAAAQDVQRCESADGKVSYAGGACPPGSIAVRTLPAAGAPSAADQQAAQQRAQQDVRQAAEIDRARKAQEQRVLHQQEQARAEKHENRCRRLQTRLRQAQEELAESERKKQAEAQRRVRRAEALYLEDCGAAKM